MQLIQDCPSTPWEEETWDKQQFYGTALLCLFPVPYPPPAGDFTLLVGDWFATPFPYAGVLPPQDALLINGVPMQRQRRRDVHPDPMQCRADPAKKTYLSRSTNSGSSKPSTASPSFNGHFPPH